MNRDYYSDKTIDKFIKKDICQNDNLLLKYYNEVNVKKFRRRLQILKVDQKVLEQSIYVFITDNVRDIILSFIGKLTKFLNPFGDLIISGGEAFNFYFDKDDRIVTSDIDTKFIPLIKDDKGKLIGPGYYKYFGYLQAIKLIIWDYLGKNCAYLSKQVYTRLNGLHGYKLSRLLGIKLPTEGPYVTRRYTLIRKKKQGNNKNNKVSEGDVLIDVELFALDLKLRYFSLNDNQIKTRVLGGLLDIAIMRPFEVGYEVVYSRDKGMYYTHPLTRKVIFNPDILIAGKKFLVEDLYLLKSLGLRPKKKEKDKKRMIGFSKNVLGIKTIKSTDSDNEIFKKALRKVKTLNSNKVNLRNRPVMNSKKLISIAKQINPSRHLKYISISNQQKTIAQFLLPKNNSRNTKIPGYTKTSGPFRFNINKKKWVNDNRSIYIKNEYNFRPNKKTINSSTKIPLIKHTDLYSYVSNRNSWIPNPILRKSALLPFIGLKK